MKVYIIDQEEHGNGGVCNLTILDHLPLKKALEKTPRDYKIYSKIFGFWPMINKSKDGKDKTRLYSWDEDDECWVKDICRKFENE